MSHTSLRVSSCVASLLCAAAVFADPPAMVGIGMFGQDISADGMTAVGSLYDSAQNKNIVYRYTRGLGGFSTLSELTDGSVRASADCSVMSFGSDNLENVGGFGTDRSIAHRWSDAAGFVNIGMLPTGNRCDFNINTAYDTSGSGRYVVGAGWTESLCGPFRAWRHDSVSNTFTQLPFSISGAPLFVPANATRADSVSSDGTVICGYDQNYNPSFSIRTRHAAAWVFNGTAWVQTILDIEGGTANGVNGTGTACVGTLSSITAGPLGSSGLNVQKWTRSGTAWSRSDKGRPVDRGLQSAGGDGLVTFMFPHQISDDGDTITGFCEYNDPGNPLSTARRRPFIWRPTLNAGVPIDLDDYVKSLPGGATTFANTTITSASGLSADANAIVVNYLDDRHADCLFTGGSGIVYLNGTTCEAPGINFSPVSQYVPGGPGSFGIIFNVFATGSWPLNFQWQRETAPGSEVWADLSDDNCGFFGVNEYDIKGSNGPQLRLGALSGTWSGRYRCVVSNSCGGATSGVGRAATCISDFDGDGFVTGDDFDAYVAIFEAGAPDADIDGDGFVTGDDFDAFVLAFESGC